MVHQKVVMSVSLTKNLKEYVKQRTKTAHYGTPSDYVRSLIRDDIKRTEQESLERELLKGLRSKSRIVNPEEWEKLKKDIFKRSKK